MLHITPKIKKKFSLGTVLLFAFLWAIIGFNTHNPDYQYYANLFDRARNGISYYAVEIGFWNLIKIASKIGMNYQTFLIFYSCAGLLLITNTVIKYSKRPSLVFLAYVCYPLFLDATQIRQFMVVAIFTFATRYLQEYSVKNVIKYCGLILLATSQQILAFALFFYLIVYIKNSKIVIRLSIILTILNFFAFRYVLRIPLVNSIFKLRNKTIDYVGGYSNRQFLMYLCFYGGLLILCYSLHKNEYSICFNGKDFLFKICVLSGCFIPFMLIDFQYTRLFRCSILIVYICITNYISLLSKRNRIVLDIFFGIMMILIFLKIFGLGSWYYDTVTLPILKYNRILNFLNYA